MVVVCFCSSIGIPYHLRTSERCSIHPNVSAPLFLSMFEEVTNEWHCFDPMDTGPGTYFLVDIRNRRMRSPQQYRRSIQRWAACPELDFVIPSLLCFTGGVTTKDTKLHKRQRNGTQARLRLRSSRTQIAKLIMPQTLNRRVREFHEHRTLVDCPEQQRPAE
jgi:hypothetical protein